MSKSQSNEHASIALAKTVSKLEGGVSYEGGNFDSQTFRGQNPIDAEIIYLQAKVDSIQHQVSLYEEDHVNLQVTLKDNPDSNATSRINAIVSDLLDDLFSLREELACEQCRIDQLKAL